MEPFDSTFYDGRIVLLPDVSQLQSGDILLTRMSPLARPRDGAQSKKIRLGTGGTFSHVLICSEPPVVIEAIGAGVSTLSLARCYAHGWESVRVVRHPDSSLAKAAARFAQLQVGRDYSIRRALRAAFPTLIADRLADQGTFCSALVAQAYVGAGDVLFTQVPIERTTPATIEKLEGLVDVTKLVFREGLAPRNVGKLVPLDAPSTASPSARQTEISGRYAKALMTDAEQIAADVSEPEIVPTHFGMLNLIMTAIDATRVTVNSGAISEEIRRLDMGLAALIASGELAAVFADLEAIESEELQEALRASFDHAPDIDRRAMQTQLATTRRGGSARREALAKMEAWNEGGRSAAVAAYAELERAVILGIERRETLFDEILRRLN